MKDYCETFVRSIPAGILIGIGGAVNCLCGNAYVSALLFSTGLYLICLAQFNLVTGKVGHIGNGYSVVDIALMFCGNYGGAMICAGLVRLANPAIEDITSAIVATRMSQPFLQTLASGALCGVLVHLSVWVYQEHHTPLGIFLCIPVFILCGFEHCVADMFYFTSAGTIHPGHIAIVFLGNALGALYTKLCLTLNS